MTKSRMSGSRLSSFAITDRLAQLHVERAGATVADAGWREAEHDRPQLGLLQPVRDVAAEHAALPLASEVAEPVGGLLAALAGDDQHRLVAPGVGLDQERAQARVGVALAQPVQIDARLDLDLARGDLPGLAAIEVGERRGAGLCDLETTGARGFGYGLGRRLSARGRR